MLVPLEAGSSKNGCLYTGKPESLEVDEFKRLQMSDQKESDWSRDEGLGRPWRAIGASVERQKKLELESHRRWQL